MYYVHHLIWLLLVECVCQCRLCSLFDRYFIHTIYSLLFHCRIIWGCLVNGIKESCDLNRNYVNHYLIEKEILTIDWADKMLKERHNWTAHLCFYILFNCHIFPWYSHLLFKGKIKTTLRFELMIKNIKTFWKYSSLSANNTLYVFSLKLFDLGNKLDIIEKS